MWVWSSDGLWLFESKRADNWRELNRSLQLFGLFDTTNVSASEDQTHMATEYLYTIIHFLMWVWSSDTLSLFGSKRGNSWSEPPRSLQLLALFDTYNASASEDQTHMGKWIIVYNYSDVMWVWSSDALTLFVSMMANNWRKLNRSLQLLALFDSNNQTASEEQTHMITE
jgi:hypothetical protein